VRETIVCMSQVLSALSYAHELGVVHREVSPANILIGADGTVKLTGFGLAKSESDAKLTRAGTVMGWLEYMSPEQVNAVVDLDGRTDIYSAGAVLYEMVSGQVPFLCKTQFELMMAHVSTQPAVPRGADPVMSQIILTALAKNPAERFQTARHFRDALESVAPVPSAAAMEAVSPTQPPPLPTQPWGLQKLVLTGVVTFLVMVVIFLAFLKISKL
jgi:serine/threonine protein kinase